MANILRAFGLVVFASLAVSAQVANVKVEGMHKASDVAVIEKTVVEAMDGWVRTTLGRLSPSTPPTLIG